MPPGPWDSFVCASIVWGLMPSSYYLFWVSIAFLCSITWSKSACAQPCFACLPWELGFHHTSQALSRFFLILLTETLKALCFAVATLPLPLCRFRFLRLRCFAHTTLTHPAELSDSPRVIHSCCISYVWLQTLAHGKATSAATRDVLGNSLFFLAINVHISLLRISGSCYLLQQPALTGRNLFNTFLLSLLSQSSCEASWT